MTELQALQNEVKQLRALVEKLIKYQSKIYYVEGTGYHDIPNKILFAGTRDECVDYVNQSPLMEMDNNSYQATPTKVKSFSIVAALVLNRTAGDDGFDELFEIAGNVGWQPEGQAA